MRTGGIQDSVGRDRSPSIKFNRRSTIKMQDIPALLSRKEKFDIYDTKLAEIDELIPEIEEHLECFEVKFDSIERKF
jgi:hypothetical protein